MNEPPFGSGCFYAETWSNDSSLSVTPEPFDFTVDYEAPMVYQREHFVGLSTPPFPPPDIVQQYVTGTHVQQSHLQPFDVPAPGRNLIHSVRPSAFNTSVSSLPNSSSLKRPYSLVSTAADLQEATYISRHNIRQHISHGQSQSSQCGHRDPSPKKHCKLAQTPISGVRFDVLSRDKV
jgi:hypothetical protein